MVKTTSLIEHGRVKVIKKIYSDVPHKLLYKIENGIDNTSRIITYMLLLDGFNTKIKLEELNFSNEAITLLELAGYKKIIKENVLVKK